MGKHLVLAGAGHAHLTTLLNIGGFVARGHRVTVIGPSPHHYYSGMGPGMLSGLYRREQTRFPVRRIAEQRGATFLEDRVTRLLPRQNQVVTAAGRDVPFDVISLNIGSGIPRETWSGNPRVIFVKPIENLLDGRRRLLELFSRKEVSLLVVGGGPAGVEISGNLWKLGGDNGAKIRITLATRETLLAGFPEKARLIAKKSLSSRGISVLEKTPVLDLKENEAELAKGRRVIFDLAFVATGVRPPRLFQAAGLATGEDGGLLVNRFLQSVTAPSHFGGGDCIAFAPRPLDKVGVYAVRENGILHHNLLAALEGRQFKTFAPPSGYLLILNLGDRTGLFCRRHLVFRGRAAFWLKRYLDWNFMRRFSPH